MVTKARDGAPDALEAIGHHGEPTTNPVCKEVLSAISAGGIKGTELQRRFATSPFGWPKDAVNGAVLTLLAAGHVRAGLEGKELTGPKELPQTQIGKATFYKEDEPPTMEQRLQVRGLLSAAGIQFEAGQEAAQISALLQRLKDLAARAGGPPPLPEVPETDHVDALLALGGNQRFRSVADDHKQINGDLERWRLADQQREKREREWEKVERFLRHADGLPVAATVAADVTAIRDGRQLLDDPDPVSPVLAVLTAALREEVNRRADDLAAAQRKAEVELRESDEWSKLEPSDQQSILADAHLVVADGPDVTTDAKLLDALDAVPLGAWQDRISLVPGLRDQARLRAAKMLEPESIAVIPPSGTIRRSEDLELYVDELRAKVEPHLAAGKTVIL